jgi:cell division protein FtsI (penicillin-binding protein 3)
MFNVVDKKWGTAHRIKDSMLSMAGKTGTCQLDYTTGNIQYISSFVGYFPAEKPKYSCIVVIHRPNKSKGYYGSTVAAPVFKKIAKKIFNDIPMKVIINHSDLKNLGNSWKKNIVPNVVGMSKEDAKLSLDTIGIKIVLKGEGNVKSQSIDPGIKVGTSQMIILELS